MSAVEGQLLWAPSEARREQSRMRHYQRWLAETRGVRTTSYAELHAWSVTELETFWESLVQYFDVRFHTRPRAVLPARTMPGTEWFSDATLSYAEHALRRTGPDVAVVFAREDGTRGELSWDELRDQVARARAGLAALGVRKGDCVAALLPNSPEALVTFLAAASLGATWSSCSPEFGVKSVLDRFGQIAPTVLLAVDGYEYGGKRFARAEAVRELMAALPTVARTVVVPRGFDGGPPGTMPYADLLAHSSPLAFEPVPFDHPLWILYSSGTTGLPKPIVQGQGGILLEHLKSLALHCDLGEGDRFFWFSTTGWMMWNFLVSGLTVGSAVVLFEGNPGYPDLGALFRLAEATGITYFGTSAPFIEACMKERLAPKGIADLARVRSVGSTGAPLSPAGFAWVYESVKDDVALGSVSGGTDVCTAFLTSCPLLPVYAGEIQCAALGVAAEAFDAAGRPLSNEVGELVITSPMPSMPLRFLNDPGGTRLRESYFAEFPGVWRHADWVRVTERGSWVVYGRSDSTLNRGGVRMGTAELYRVVESIPEVADSLVVDTSTASGEGELILFLVPKAAVVLDAALEKRVRATLRADVSPRHVPDRIVAIPEVPRTLNGKKLEVPVKRLLMGVPRERALNPGTVGNLPAVDALLDAERASRPRPS